MDTGYKFYTAVAVAAGAAGLAALWMAQPTFTAASQSMLPYVASGEIVHCADDDELGGLTYGDFIIYRHPAEGIGEAKQLKMVAGLAGDSVRMREGVLWINGEAIKRRQLGDYALPDDPGHKAIRYETTLPGGARAWSLDIEPANHLDNMAGDYKVPEGHIFVIGSNLDRSFDSRSLELHGPVPLGKVICRAEIAR